MHSILMKIHPVGAGLFHTDRQMNGQADLMKLIVHFRNFANAPKNYILILMVNFSINDSENMKQVQKKKNLKITYTELKMAHIGRNMSSSA